MDGLKTMRGGISAGMDISTVRCSALLREASGGMAESVADAKIVVVQNKGVVYLVESNTVLWSVNYRVNTNIGSMLEQTVFEISETTTVNGVIVDPVNKTVHTTSKDFIYAYIYS